MTKELEKSIVFLKSKNILPVYCPNENLGTEGPFIQLDTMEEIEIMINIEDRKEPSFVEEGELLITGT